MTQFPEFKLIKQETDYDCGAAVTAMALGMTLKEAKEQLTVTKLKEGVNYYRTCHIAEILAKHGIILGLYLVVQDTITVDTKAFVEFTLEEWPCILAVKSATFSDYSHFVFWDGNKILDPQKQKPTKLKDYEIEDIYPLTIINDL